MSTSFTNSKLFIKWNFNLSILKGEYQSDIMFKMKSILDSLFCVWTFKVYQSTNFHSLNLFLTLFDKIVKYKYFCEDKSEQRSSWHLFTGVSFQHSFRPLYGFDCTGFSECPVICKRFIFFIWWARNLYRGSELGNIQN